MISKSEKKEIYEEINVKLRLRSQLYFNIRQWLYKMNFIEVDTPTFCKPKTDSVATSINFKNAKPNFKFTLARAGHLKRILFVKGINRAYEIRHRIRPDSPSKRHLPEFSSLELVFKTNSISDAISIIESLFSFLINEYKSLNKGKCYLEINAPIPILDAKEIVKDWKNLPLEENDRKKILIKKLENDPLIIEYFHELNKIPLDSLESIFLENSVKVNQLSWVQYSKLPEQLELISKNNLELLNLFSFAYSPKEKYWGAAIGIDRILMCLTGKNINDVNVFHWNYE